MIGFNVQQSGDDWEALFIVTNAGFGSIWLAGWLTGRVEAGDGSLVSCHPATLLPPCHPATPCNPATLHPATPCNPATLLQYVQPPLLLLWYTYTSLTPPGPTLIQSTNQLSPSCPSPTDASGIIPCNMLKLPPAPQKEDEPCKILKCHVVKYSFATKRS